MKKIILSLFTILLAVAANAQQDSTYKEYAGKYNFPDGSVITNVIVSFDNGALSMSSSQGNSSLDKTSTADVFVITSFQGTASFRRNDAKKVIGVVIEAMGYHLEGAKDNGIVFIKEKNNLKLMQQHLLVR